MVSEGADALVNLDENVLKDVLGVLVAAGTGADVAVQPAAEAGPHVIGGHCHVGLQYALSQRVGQPATGDRADRPYVVLRPFRTGCVLTGMEVTDDRQR